jgi:GMP synthase (glutamine-hydrolysing)
LRPPLEIHAAADQIPRTKQERMSVIVMKIGILVTGHVHDDLKDAHGAYPAMFERLLAGHGFKFAAYDVVDGVFPRDVNECDGWLITGSRHGAYEPHAWIPPLEDFIRKAYGADVPMVGICFGHQIMAQALGGKVEKHKGGWGVGPTEYETAKGKVKLHAMHQDQVTKRPPEAETIASAEYCEFAGFAYKGRALSYQPHPEFPDGYMRDIIRMRAGTVIPAGQAKTALEKVGDELDSGSIAADIAAFFKQAARKAA